MSKEVEVIVFKEPCKRKKSSNNLNEKKNIKRNHEEERKMIEIELKKARHDVYKFAISGLDKDEMKNAKKKLAISLGAKPTRRKYINYRVLLENKSKAKLENK